MAGSSTPTAALPEAVPGMYAGTADVPGVGTMPLCSYDCGGDGFMTILAVAAVVVGGLTGIDEGAAAAAGTAEVTSELVTVLSGDARSAFTLAA
jgi:hypothetical protein